MTVQLNKRRGAY